MRRDSKSDSPLHQSGQRSGNSPGVGAQSQGLPSVEGEIHVVVTASQLLQELQQLSGSKAFCNAQQFETALVRLGLDFNSLLVTTVSGLCPISDDGVINFTPLYRVCEELEALQQTGMVGDVSSLSSPTANTSPATAAGATTLAAGTISSHVATQQHTGSAHPTPERSSNMFPVHRFASTPLGAEFATTLAGNLSDVSAVPLPNSLRNTPGTSSRQSAENQSTHVSLTVEL